MKFTKGIALLISCLLFSGTCLNVFHFADCFLNTFGSHLKIHLWPRDSLSYSFIVKNCTMTLGKWCKLEEECSHGSWNHWSNNWQCWWRCFAFCNLLVFTCVRAYWPTCSIRCVLAGKLCIVQFIRCIVQYAPICIEWPNYKSKASLFYILFVRRVVCLVILKKKKDKKTFEVEEWKPKHHP